MSDEKRFYCQLPSCGKDITGELATNRQQRKFCSEEHRIEARRLNSGRWLKADDNAVRVKDRI